MEWGWIGLPSTSANTQPEGSIPTAPCSAACHLFHGAMTPTVVGIEVDGRLELLILPRDSCSS